MRQLHETKLKKVVASVPGCLLFWVLSYLRSFKVEIKFRYLSTFFPLR